MASFPGQPPKAYLAHSRYYKIEIWFKTLLLWETVADFKWPINEWASGTYPTLMKNCLNFPKSIIPFLGVT